ncbi:MAG TPA: hypothetical protein VL401_04145 [Alphaproteobacteria bacterium]|jgi:hypothetical protein|nr:hypothetical protein [Alphaproteobacteria bacterium]
MKTYKNYILITICGILAAISVFLTIEAATSGAEIANLDKTAKELTDQKRILEESLVKGISMSQLTEKSAELGFVKPENLVYVSNSAPKYAAKN